MAGMCVRKRPGSTRWRQRRTGVWTALALIPIAGCASQPKPTPVNLAPAPAYAIPRRLTLDSSIETICATAMGKAVLDRDLPGLTARPEYAMFKAMTLRQLQPLSQGHITTAELAKVQADLTAVN